MLIITIENKVSGAIIMSAFMMNESGDMYLILILRILRT